ncbi:MAG: hypothetical protein WB626_11460 [Bacteroidota bacterium]
MEKVLKSAEVEGGNVVCRCTLSDLDQLSGALAAAANYAESQPVQRRLGAVCDKISAVLEALDDGLFGDMLLR